ncbi:aminotransferase class V-fold PLP-dependent enzyme [Alcaligenaceae bacterium B3P038]|nr:aminotransferase class V-fold PLP-dependent enzyme [Alcaligenaceae bacterium B3P038]
MTASFAVINAWGTPTPFGVSRSPLEVAAAAAGALTRHTDIERLQDAVATMVTAQAGTEAACFCHCAAAGVTLAVAAALTGTDAVRIAALPDVADENVVAIQTEHQVNYGHPITQAIRLAGAKVLVLDGTVEQRIQQLADHRAAGTLAAVVAVSSTLVKTPAPIGLVALAKRARDAGVPFIVDAAAQDWRLNDPTWFNGIDIAIFSAQKYLAAPTCGILTGSAAHIAAARANLGGIGRGMKPTKEALAGVAAALPMRAALLLSDVRDANMARAHHLIASCGDLPYRFDTLESADYGPYPRIALTCSNAREATMLADALRQHEPSIVVGRHALSQGVVTLELTHVTDEEAQTIVAALHGSTASRA